MDKKEYNKRYQLLHKDSIKQYNHEYFLQNKEKIREKKRLYYQKTKELYKMRQQKWVAKNRDKIKEKNKEWLDKHPEYKIKRDQQKKQETKILRDIIITALDNKCVCCGETTKDFLQIHHKNGGGNQHRKEKGAGYGVYKEIVETNSFNEYELLCANCHFALTYYGKCPHKG